MTLSGSICIYIFFLPEFHRNNSYVNSNLMDTEEKIDAIYFIIIHGFFFLFFYIISDLFYFFS